MIVITGATGQLGRQVVAGLATKMPATAIGLSVRDPEKANDLRERGIRVSKGDFTDAASLATAFDAAEQVLLVSVNLFGDEAVRRHDTAIRAAKQAGVKRILYTSHQGANAASAFVPARTHFATEELLRSSGVPFVSLRNGFYAESAMFQMSGLRETGTISLPADGPVSWTARADLAEAAVAALTEPKLFDGISPALTSTQTLDFADIAALASQMLGREVERETVSDEAYRAMLISRGLPEVMADALGTLYTAARAREFAVLDPTLERVLGRRPTAVKDVLSTYLAKA